MSKTVLVTGASRGIGLEIVRQLAARKATVILACRDAQKGKKAIASLQEKDHVEILPLDVTSPENIRAAAREYSARHDSLDVLINNAGVLHDGDNDIASLDPELIQRTMQTNTLGPLRVTQGFLPLLRKSRQPRIINISSG